MGFQARKSFKVMPGVRMTVSKSGLSTSVGTTGARISRTSSGRVTRTVGIPGSGLSHTKTVGGSRSSASAGQREPAPSMGAQPVKPGVLAPRWEKDLYKALTTSRFDELPLIGAANPDEAGLVAALDASPRYRLGITRGRWRC